MLEDDFNFVLSVGLAGGRSEICVECVAIKIDDDKIQDKTGNHPINEMVGQEGRPAYCNNMATKKMVHEMDGAGVPARLSSAAGTFVCNHVLYQLGSLVDTEFPAAKFGFIHVPYAEERVENKNRMPAMPLADIVRGLHAAIEAMVDGGDDLISPFGELH